MAVVVGRCGASPHGLQRGDSVSTVPSPSKAFGNTAETRQCGDVREGRGGDSPELARAGGGSHQGDRLSTVHTRGAGRVVAAACRRSGARALAAQHHLRRSQGRGRQSGRQSGPRGTHVSLSLWRLAKRRAAARDPALTAVIHRGYPVGNSSELEQMRSGYAEKTKGASDGRPSPLLN